MFWFTKVKVVCRAPEGGRDACAVIGVVVGVVQMDSDGGATSGLLESSRFTLVFSNFAYAQKFQL